MVSFRGLSLKTSHAPPDFTSLLRAFSIAHTEGEREGCLSSRLASIDKGTAKPHVRFSSFRELRSKEYNAHIGPKTMNVENKPMETPAPSGNDGSGAPSGFILKLFQMVNGAPDEVISWTPAGDAFIIGSDLNRLESETLPQYFRHNRFQSLVRQLNFYSFRKINRERNVWIYKHKLFHRDHPEDLYQVRRRTCPGVDGRKQRFSRYSAQKLSKFEDGKENPSSGDESSVEGASADENQDSSSKKRRASNSSVTSSSKRPRRLWDSGDPEKKVKVVTSILPEPMASLNSVFDAHKTQVREIDNEPSTNKKSERMEMLERSMIVSEVAMKLEEYVKKAMKGRRSGRSRRAGVVTPPYGSSSSSTFSSAGLITYDDEYDKEDFTGVVTDGEDSVDSTDVTLPGTECKATKAMFVAPICCEELVHQIVEEIRKRASYNFYNAEMIHVCANVAGLLMSTAPGEDAAVCCGKILELLAASDRLAADFHFYRAALHPQSASDSGSAHGRFEHEHAVALRLALETSSSRHDALREFKIFAVNLIYKLLGKNGSFDIQQPFSHSEFANLIHTADAWSKSVGRVV